MLARLLLLACGIAGIASRAPAAESRPNILFIVADDLGWSDVGWHGGFGRTPHLDRLVREGIELDQHYVQPVCTPTRTALMSGRYPGRFGPHALSPSNLRAMPLDTVTLASALRSLGYATCQAGKWHLGSLPEWGPTAFGFDHGYGTLTGAADPWTHKYEDTWHRDGQRLDEPGNATELVAAEVVHRIEEQRSPWFIYVGFHAVHTPVDAPEEFKRIYDGVKFHNDPVLHESRLRMAAEVSQLDAKVGEFVDALERTGQRDRTLIVFTSDNGGIESLKNAYVGTVPGSPLNSENDPLRGQKATVYEGGIRVCAFANWRGVLEPRKLSVPMHGVDWFPTLADLVGYQPESDLRWDGLNRWPVLSGATQTAADRTIYIASTRGHALRHGDWKLVQPEAGNAELYNLAVDPYEHTNLASLQSQKVKDLQSMLAEQQALDEPKLPADLEGIHN